MPAQLTALSTMGAASLTGDDGIGFAVALGIGLLLGAERERRKGEGASRRSAGIRTFALAAMLGAASAMGGITVLTAVAGGFVAVATIVAYALSDREDPGLTSEVALMLAFVLGALAIEEPELAAASGVAVAVLLVARAELHRFVASVMTEDELRDALVFIAAAVVILPLMPDEGYGPQGSVNPFRLWKLVVILMAVSGVGYIALRTLGPRFGLPLAGFASGFVSSSATVGAMGGRARREPGLAGPAVAGAVLSTVATVAQMAIVVGIADKDTLRRLALPLVLAGIAAIAYGAAFAVRAVRAVRAESVPTPAPGHAFEAKPVLLFAAMMTSVLFIAAVATEAFGSAGLLLATAATGFADAHAAGASAAALAATSAVSQDQAVFAILVGFTTNSATKLVVAFATGTRRYAAEVAVGLLVVAAAAWAGFGATLVLR